MSKSGHWPVASEPHVLHPAAGKDFLVDHETVLMLERDVRHRIWIGEPQVHGGADLAVLVRPSATRVDHVPAGLAEAEVHGTGGRVSAGRPGDVDVHAVVTEGPDDAVAPAER